jgi:hypothetical protein
MQNLRSKNNQETKVTIPSIVLFIDRLQEVWVRVAFSQLIQEALLGRNLWRAN